ncbi:MAG: phospholipase D-like domain-containing protein [Elusimicrobia bacterium]|nr:phospholipase D-like domain-containing protein [Elusimicrobiota bacterium]
MRIFRKTKVALLSAAFLFSCGPLRVSALSSGGGQRDFAIAFSPEELQAPQVPAPLAAVRTGDFSSVTPYNFAYLNDLNTKLIDLADSSVDVVMFSITLKDNPDALLRAKERGVRIRMVVDESHLYPKADPQIKRLISAGVDIRTLRGTGRYGVNHNKILICDGKAVAVGSYNWTFGATFSNHENTMVAQHPAYLAGYNAYFEWMWSKARVLSQGPSQEVPEGYYGKPPQDPSPVMELNGTKVPAYLFSPGSATEDRLAAILRASRRSADIVTFSFSSRVLAEAVIDANRRGVKVRFLMDRNMAKGSGLAKLLFSAGVPFRWGIGRNEKGALHDKFAILDGVVMETGSFNWTSNASRHSFENVIFTNDAEAIKAYQYVFDWLYDHAEAPAAADFDSEAQ